jgi:hypothetical protein
MGLLFTDSRATIIPEKEKKIPSAELKKLFEFKMIKNIDPNCKKTKNEG